jgi:PAS domain S-box-containing protein
MGDASAIAALHDGSQRYTTSLRSLRLTAGSGQIRFITVRDQCLPESLLDVTAGQLSLHMDRQILAERVELAEARVHERISDIAAIYEMDRSIDQTDVQALYNLITRRARRLLDGNVCSLMMVERETNTLRVVASEGLPAAAHHTSQGPGDGIAGRVVVTEQPLLVVGDFRDGVRTDPAIGSSMVAPLKRPEGIVIGVLAVRRNRPSTDYTDDDLKLFTLFSSQAALALTNMMLYQDVSRRAGERLKLYGLTRALISTLDLDELVNRVADEIRNVVGFDRCCIYMRDLKRNVYAPRVAPGYPASVMRNPVKEGDGAIGYVARSQTPILFDARQPPPTGAPRDRIYLLKKGFARSLGTDSFVANPIVGSRGECLGVVVADNRTRRAPVTKEQVDLLSAFVSQAGLALENARLYEQMEENLKDTHQLNNYLDSVFESVGAGIVATDIHGKIVKWNHSAADILSRLGEFRPQFSLSENFSNLRLPHSERETLKSLMHRASYTQESPHKLTLHPRGSEPVSIQLILTRLRDQNEENAGLVVIFEDITSEQRLAAVEEKMRRLADISQLAAKMAHEVRNALSPIKGAAQIVRADLEAQEGGTEWPDIIIAEVDGLSRLTSEMLDFARPMPMNPSPLNVSEFLYGAVHSLRIFLDEHATRVHWSISLGLPEINADSVYLGQVVRNIVMNAAQAMPSGGDLFIEASYDDRTHRVAMRFRDTGEGIPREDIERIFRPFVTTKTKGTGLGLPIAQKIVDHHGGQVLVDSIPGLGTTFTVLLPLQPPREVVDTEILGRPIIEPTLGEPAAL